MKHVSEIPRAQFGKETGNDGSWQRQQSLFRRWISSDPSSEFPAEQHRYHLYVSAACPWAHRAIIVRLLKGLQDTIGMTIVDPIRDDLGWRFGQLGRPETGEVDPLHGWTHLSQAYIATEPEFDARVTVPTLWDTQTNSIVNNESADVIRMLNSEFNAFASNPQLDLYPDHLRTQIDDLNEWIYATINNGVYKAGFAVTQAAYESAVTAIFESFDRLEQLLSTNRYLTGDTITEADWRLFTTLVRFDAVYVGHFKCNIRRLVDYPNLWAYTRELYQHPGIANTVNFDHIKRHYYVTHDRINPSGVVPLGPEIDWLAPHGRG